jgi:hypothetical protein
MLYVIRRPSDSMTQHRMNLENTSQSASSSSCRDVISSQLVYRHPLYICYGLWPIETSLGLTVQHPGNTGACTFH